MKTKTPETLKEKMHRLHMEVIAHMAIAKLRDETDTWPTEAKDYENLSEEEQAIGMEAIAAYTDAYTEPKLNANRKGQLPVLEAFAE